MNTKKNISRIISVTLVLLLAFTSLPMLSFAASGNVKIDITNFPDKNFRFGVSQFDKNKDGVLSKTEIANVKKMEIEFGAVNGKYPSSGTDEDIKNFKGLKFFTALETFDCSDTEIKAIDVSKNVNLKNLIVNNNALQSLDVRNNKKLQVLDCSYNKITSLDLSKNTELLKFSCDDNKLTALDLRNCKKLTEIDCSSNPFAKLDLPNTSTVKSLACASNKITNLNLIKFTNLRELYCVDNQLTALDLSKNVNLESLFCSENNLTTLNLSKNTKLKELNCTANKLTALDLSKNTALTDIDCSENKITALDLSKNLKLEGVFCDGNQLKTLKVPNNIEYVYCSKNKLKTLDLSNRKNLDSISCEDNELETLNISDSNNLYYLYCRNNRLKELDLKDKKYLVTLDISCNDFETLDISRNKQLDELNCSGNRLTSLDVSNQRQAEVSAFNNDYRVYPDANNKVDLNKLPGSFSVLRASNWKGGSVSGNTLTFGKDSKRVTYSYMTSLGKKVTFSLSNHEHTNKITKKITPATLRTFGLIETISACTICGCVDERNSKAETIYSPDEMGLSQYIFEYDGKVKNPTVSVKTFDGKLLKNGTDYTVTVPSGRKDVGIYIYTINFKGKYSGTQKFGIKILPAQVKGLKSAKQSTSAIVLSWSKVTGAKYYKVEQSTDGKKWTTLTTTTATSFTAKKLKTGAKYQYRVTAIDSTKKLVGKDSAVLKTATLTAAPSIALKTTKSKTATVSWKAVSGASNYMVYKSVDGKKWSKAGTTTKTAFNLTNLAGGKKIYVKVYANNAYTKHSAASAVKSITVKK